MRGGAIVGIKVIDEPIPHFSFTLVSLSPHPAMNYVIEIFFSYFTPISLSLLLPQFLFSICLFYLPLFREISSSTIFPRDTASLIISSYLSPTTTSFLYWFFFFFFFFNFFFLWIVIWIVLVSPEQHTSFALSSKFLFYYYYYYYYYYYCVFLVNLLT